LRVTIIGMADANAKPRRRWFQFSLHALLIVMTVLAGCIAWTVSEVRYVRLRQAMRTAALEGDGRLLSVADWEARPEVSVNNIRSPVTIPIWRRWMGDGPMLEVAIPYGSSDSTLHAAKLLFPEAQVYVAQPHVNVSGPQIGGGMF
jgi:hypothetical protein